MTFAIKGGGTRLLFSFFRPQKQVFFWVKKHYFKPLLVCFENRKWKKSAFPILNHVVNFEIIRTDVGQTFPIRFTFHYNNVE